MEEHITAKDVLADLRARPHIDVSRQPAGTNILVETTQGILEIDVLDPADGLIRLSGTDPKIKAPRTCRLLQSDYDLQGVIFLPKWIGKELRMKIEFANATFHCSATLSAAIRLKSGKYYDVF